MEEQLYSYFDTLFAENAEKSLNKKETIKGTLTILNSAEYANHWLGCEKKGSTHTDKYSELQDPHLSLIKMRDAEMSKGDVKRERKRLIKVSKMAEKAQKKSQNPQNKQRVKVDTSSMTLEQYITYRKSKFTELGLEMYPHKFSDNISIDQFVRSYNYLSTDKMEKEIKCCLSGQVLYCRESSKKLFFFMIESRGKKLQVMANMMHYTGDKSKFTQKCSLICRGDHIGVLGFPYRSKSGELSIVCEEFHILSPCLLTLPKLVTDGSGNEFTNFSDVEARFRKRYQDFKINLNSRNVLKARSKVIRTLRNYLDDMNFDEVETPILNIKASGASAKPFVTYCNDLKLNMSMRIAPELYLKRMLVGGFDRVYEIGKQFRNESIDPTHSPEFTSCEFYIKGDDYNDLMRRTEDILSKIAKAVTDSYVTDYDVGEEKKSIDWSPPYARLDVMKDLPEEIRLKGVEFDWPEDLFSDEANLYLQTKCDELKIECVEPRTTPRLLDSMIGELLECKCQNPTFIMNHPQVMSPLAKYHRSIPQSSERFELFVMEKELINAFTELNDPELQLKIFQAQLKDRVKGDDEAPEPDLDYITALQTGLPPCAGWGLGIDRLVMFLMNKHSIREVIAFPTMKPL